MEDPRELSPSQAAARLGTTTRTVQRWIAQGRLPARRVGGRWRVASDALDAFDERRSRHGSEPERRCRRAAPRPASDGVRREPRRDRRPDPPDRRPPGHPRRRPGRRTATAPSTCSTRRRGRGGRSAAGADALHPGLRLPGRERRLRRRGRRGADPLGRAAGRRDPGDGRQGGRPSPRGRAWASRSSPATTRRPVRRRALGRRGRADRLPAHRQAGGGRWRQGHAGGARPRRRSRRALAAARREARAAFGDDRLILERSSRARATSRSRSCSTRTATASISASATARSSGATRRSSRRRRRRRVDPASGPRLATPRCALAARRRLRERRDVRVPRSTTTASLTSSR